MAAFKMQYVINGDKIVRKSQEVVDSEPETNIHKNVPVSLELLQRIWLELYRSPDGKENYKEFQNTIDDVIGLLDKWNALPDLD